MVTSKSRRRAMLAGVSISVALLSAIGSETSAQGASPGAAAPDGSLALEEIVVTARRTEEKLLDVPIAVTAFTAEEIESRGIRNLDDIAALTPGLTFSNVLGEFLPAPVLRGIAPVSIFAENNVGIYIDGVYVSGREGLNFSQLDLETINVVKGPQAALYGRNAFAGAINYVTARPTNELLRKVEVQLGNEGKKLAQAVLSGPIAGDTVQGRIALAYDDWDGSYTNRIAGGPDIGGYEYKTVSASLRFTPSERFEGLIWAYYSDDQIDPSATSQVIADCENRNVFDPMQSSKFLNVCGDLPTVNENSLAAMVGAEGESREVARAHLDLKWTFDAGTLTALTGYSTTEQAFLVDGSRGSGAVPFVYAAMAPTATTPRPVRTIQANLLQIGLGDTTDEISQEIRFSSPQDRPLRWAVGLYYYDTRSDGGNDGVIASPALPADFASFCPCVMISPTLGFPTPGASDGANASFLPWFTDPIGGAYPLAVRTDTEAYSVFGSVDYDLTDRWTLRVEGRWADEKKRVTSFAQSGAVTRTAEESWSLPSWRLNLRYKPAENWTIYGSVAKAPKSGDFAGGNVRFSDNPNVQVSVFRPYETEALLAYELGAKAQLLDGRVRLEFDVFYNDWTDQVLPNIVNEVDGRPITQPTSFETNAGDSTSKGVEFTIEAKLTERLRANFGGSLSDATFDTASLTTFALFPSFGPSGNVSGKDMLRQSSSQFTAGFSYEVPFRDTLTWYLRSDVAYRGEQPADAVNQAFIPENTILGARLGLRSDNWTVELWGLNLTHEDAPSGAFRDVAFTNFAPNLPFAGAGSFFPFRWSVSHPRLTQFGITGRVKF
jgi:iron complex outermembrane recepter protein